MSRRNFSYWEDDFVGPRVFTAGALDSTGMWQYTDTSSLGAPTCAVVDGSKEAGEVKLTFSADSEIQNLCLSHNDKLWLPLNRIQRCGWRIKQGVATLDAATSWAVGLAGDRNDTIDTIAQALLFRGIGSNAIVVETDDGTTDLDDKATGKSMDDDLYHDFEINFATGLKDVRFLIDNLEVARDTKFDVSAYTGALQPYLQLQKTADTNVDSITADLFWVELKRGLTEAA